MVELKQNGTILKNGQEVGYLGWHENMIVDVYVDKNHRNNGIATEAVSKLVDNLRPEYEIVKVNTVLSPEMETVLKKNEFENKVVKDPIMDMPESEDIDKVPKEEKIVWFRRLQS